VPIHDQLPSTTFLDPKVLAAIGNLELLARTVVDGFLHGVHRAARLGLSMEFAQHRQYMPGDDIRKVDWRVYGRTDRFYVKEYEAETNASVMLLLDISPSMTYSSGGVSKLDYGRFLAASLAWFSARQRDRVGLVLFDQNIVEALVRTSADVDPTSGGKRLAELAETLGRALNLNDYQVQTLRTGALLHDVGKLGVRKEVICKPGPLTDEEYEEVRLHPLIGERMCAPLHLSRELGQIIRHHHERWDGGGYVDGLTKVEIPLLARVISVVDAFDAMTITRPYRDALSPEEALSRLKAGAGSQWDPEVIEVFLNHHVDEQQLAA